MRLEQLEYVAAVTRTGSLRRASETLHVSQPALSEAEAKLERELGVTLLDRRRSGARMSHRGRDLLPLITDVLDAAERLRHAAGRHRTTARQVRVGTVNTAMATVVAPTLRAFQEQHPAVGVELVDLPHAELVVALDEGSLDIGLVNVLESDDLPATLRTRSLLTGRPVAVLPADHPLTAAEAVSADDLRRERFVLMRTGFLMNRYAYRFFADVLPETCHTADGAEVGKLMVAQGLGISLLPEFSVADDPLEQTGLITRRPLRTAPDPPPTVHLMLLERRASTASAQVEALREEFLRQAARAQSSG
jgi:DNA-binding transcriptional LysR family regulator